MKISVVIPAFNEEKLLEKSLESLRAQHRPADEIIVVDNNSTDATAAVAKAYGATVIHEPQQGIYPVARAGYDAAHGDVIARCDADSILPANWLQIIEDSFTSDAALGAVTGPGDFYGISAVRAKLAKLWYMYAYFMLVGSALARWPVFGSNFAMRASPYG